MSEHLGSLEPTSENINGLETFLLQIDEKGVPLDSKLSEFLQGALHLLESGETVVFLSQEPLCGAQYGQNSDLCTKPRGHENERPRTADTAVHHNKWGTVWV